MDGHYLPASFGKRLLAWLLDGILFTVISGFVTSAFLYEPMLDILTRYSQGIISIEQYIEEFTEIFSVGNLYPLMLFQYAYVIVYYVLLAYYLKGATLGKRICGIKVVDENDETPSFMKLFVRDFLIKYLVNSFTCGILNLVSLIKILVSEDKLAIHDMVAKTRCVGNDKSIF